MNSCLNINKIGIVVAMKEELLVFMRANNVQIHTEQVGGYSVDMFSLENKSFFVVQCGMGKVYAAAATQLLISRYGAEAILNFGVSGTLTDTVEVMERVLVKEIVCYDYDVSPIADVEVGQMVGLDRVISCRNPLFDIAAEICSNIRQVRCASADKFVHIPSDKEYIRDEFGAQICEMESGAVALTAMTNDVPYLIIKAVSDGKGGAEEFREKLNEAAAQYIDIIFKIIEKI